jgi:hypothetical protein
VNNFILRELRLKASIIWNGNSWKKHGKMLVFSGTLTGFCVAGGVHFSCAPGSLRDIRGAAVISHVFEYYGTAFKPFYVRQTQMSRQIEAFKQSPSVSEYERVDNETKRINQMLSK